VALGAKDEDTLTSLASRIVRLNAQMTPSERKEFQEITGASAGQTAQALLDAFDPDVIAAHAGISLPEEGEPTPEQQALDREVRERLLYHCKRLKPPYDEIARLYFYEERRPDEIARLMGRNVRTVQTQIYRARNLLRKIYRKECG